MVPLIEKNVVMLLEKRGLNPDVEYLKTENLQDDDDDDEMIYYLILKLKGWIR